MANETTEITSTNAKAVFMNEIAPELFGREVEEVKEDEATLSNEETSTEDKTGAPVEEGKKEVEKDDDESILGDLLGNDDPDGGIEGTQEDEKSIDVDNTTHTYTVDGVEHTTTTTALLRLAGQETSLNEEKKSVKAMQEKLDSQANTLEYLQYQGEFTPKFVGLQNTANRIEDAKVALAEGKMYEGKSGDSLGAAITSAEVIFKREAEKVQGEYNQHMAEVRQPGYEALEKRLPDVGEKFEEYSQKWSDVGSEFGFTQVELTQRRDPRFDNMSQEILELREYKSTMEGKIKKAKGRRKGKQVAGAGSKNQASTGNSNKQETSTNFTDLSQRAADGDHQSRIDVMKDIRSW